jgi:DNA-binding NtrC family response regulator
MSRVVGTPGHPMRFTGMSSSPRAAPAFPDVLVVEDDPAVLQFMAGVLAEDGFNVSCASDAVAALALLEQGLSPSVLVTDIHLAGNLSGLQLARAVAEAWPRIRLLIVSGESRPSQDLYPERAMFFTKPFAPGALVAIIRSSDW